jgi:hypothetical protein
MKYIRSSHNNPCPICNDTKGKCQTSYDGNFVMCMNTHSEVNGHHFLGITKNGIWGMHSLTDMVLSEQEKLDRKIAKEKAEKERLETHRKESLSIADRDKAIRAIHKELGLTRADRERLIKRGLTDSQIESGLFFSVRGYTKIPNHIPSNLSGVSIDRSGNKYLYFDDGFACPVFDSDGNAIGWQYRSNLVDSAKYKWAKSIKSSHLPNGELPITFISGDKVHEIEKDSHDCDQLPKSVTQQWLENISLPYKFIENVIISDNLKDGIISDNLTIKDVFIPDDLTFIEIKDILISGNLTLSEMSRLLNKKKREELISKVQLLEKEKLKIIFATEGLLKPYVASCRHGVDTMGAAGFHFSTSHEQVKEIISKGGYNCVVLPLDGGAILNSMIMNQLAKNVELFKSLGCQVFIGWWGQVNKTDQDFDEIESLNQVQLLDYEDIKEFSNKRRYFQWKEEELNKLKGFKADKTIDKPRFYDDGAVSDPEIDPILNHNKVVIIRGSKASGKSYMIKQYIKRWLKSGGKVVNIGCRRVLCESQSSEWEITYISDAENESYSLPIIFERDGGISIVVDSLLKLKYIDWSNTLIIIDEFEQFVSHTLTANTAVKDKRGYVLQMIENSFRESLNSGGKIIGLDADSSDLSCDWLEKVTQIKPFKLENIAKSHNNKAYILNGDKETYNLMIQKILKDLKEEEILVVSDSKKDLMALLIAVKKEYPDLPCEIITSDTVTDKHIRDFIKHPDKSIEDTQVAMLGCSPVMQSGVSINIKGYFKKVYGICSGVIEPSVMRQLLGRVRDNCDRYLWIADRAKGQYSYDFDYHKILKDSFFNNFIDLAQYQKSINEHMTNEEILIKITKLMKNDRVTDINSVTKAKLTARRNLVLSDYRNILIEELENEGYSVSSDILYCDEEGITLTKINEEIDMSEAIAINSADDIDKEKAEKIKKKPNPEKKEKYQLKKFFIKDNLPKVELDPFFILDFILKDRYKYINAVKRWWFTQNKEVAKHLDTKAIHYQSKIALTGGKFWLEDIKAHLPYIELFERLRLSELINNEDLTITKNSEESKAFFDRCKDHRNKVNGISNRALLRSCGIKFTNNIEVVQLMNRILKLYGFNLRCSETTKNEKGLKIKHYKIYRFYKYFTNNQEEHSKTLNDVTQSIDESTNKAIILFDQLIASFDSKYLNLEPINYDFELENNGYYEPEINVHSVFSNSEAVSYTEKGIDSRSSIAIDIIKTVGDDPMSKQDIVTDSDSKSQKTILEPKLSSNNQELIGKKCNFWDNNNQWSTGFIIDILDFGIKIKDYLTEKISFCAMSQIELLTT